MTLYQRIEHFHDDSRTIFILFMEFVAFVGVMGAMLGIGFLRDWLF
jgi:hypothetical protein